MATIALCVVTTGVLRNGASVFLLGVTAAALIAVEVLGLPARHRDDRPSEVGARPARRRGRGRS